jgi:hypothetical protein
VAVVFHDAADAAYSFLLARRQLYFLRQDELNVRHGAVTPQNAARSQNPTTATSQSCLVTSFRTRRRLVSVTGGFLLGC